MNEPLSAHDWQQVQRIFELALDCPADQLDALLLDECNSNSLIHQAVLKLLHRDQQLTRFAAEQANDHLLGIINQQEITTEIGRYRLIKKLQQGGMGQIFLAERSDNEFDKQVVVKLMRTELFISNWSKEKFRNERQILANLEHPNIARLLDGGTLNNGTPYVVMEYIQGKPITDYCIEQQPSLKQLIQLFLKLCSALEYAHQKLVIHRDIKPANILVTPEGEPKLLDFGIASESQFKIDDDNQSTQATDSPSGTPGYASPEQLLNQAQYASSDIYSMGILLYQLIGGKLPFSVNNTAHNKSDLLRQMGTVPKCLPTTRQGFTHWPSMGKELNLIIEHALQFEQNSRYQSCGELSRDLKRLLNQQPISIHPFSMAYRARKFILRNRMGVGLVATVLIMLCVFLINNINHTRQLELERDKAQQTKGFLIELFQISDPSESRGNTVTVREILDRGAERIESELQNQPKLQTDLMLTMGAVYRSLALYQQAESMLEQSVALSKQHFDISDPQLAEALMQLAWLYKQQREFTKAEKLSREALTLRQTHQPDNPIVIAKSLNNLGTILEDFDKTDEAEPLYREALDLRQQHLPPIHADIAVSLNNLAGLLRRKQDYSAAETLYKQSLDIRRELYGDEHPAIATILSNLGVFLRITEKHEEAEALHREALAVQLRLYDSEHPAVALAMLRLASTIGLTSQYSEAEILLQQALAIYQKLYDDDNFNVLRTLSNIGVLASKTGDFATSENAFRKVTRGFQNIYDGDHANIVLVMNNLAVTLILDGQYEAAETTLKQSLEMENRLNGNASTTVAEILVTSSTLYTKQGDHFQAQQLAEQALEIYQQRLEPMHWRLAMTNSVLADALTGLQQFEQAESLLLESYRLILEVKGKDIYITNQVVERLINLYAAWDKPERVEYYTARLGKPR